MPRAHRSDQFDAAEICVVHTIQRCVRRAFLAGTDPLTGKDYSFRRDWIRRRMEALASVFAIDVLSYAIMSNHVHQILRNRPDLVTSWSDEEVAIRWLKVFPGRRLDEQLAEPTKSDIETLCRDKQRLAEIRIRLSDISWFMRALAEPIARMANRSDKCTGRFWEGRFKAQRIVDEAGLLACSMYVDLNPVRAAMAKTPDDSVHTSAYDRIQASKGKTMNSAAFDLVPIKNEEAGERFRTKTVEQLRNDCRRKRRNPTGRKIRRDRWLAPLTLQPGRQTNDPQPSRDGLRGSDKGFLNLSLRDYLRILRWTARQKFGSVAAAARIHVPKSLERTLNTIGIDAGMWRDLVWNYRRYFGGSICVGRPETVRQHAEQTGRRWHRGHANSATCFA